MRRFLVREGCDVVTAKDGTEGLKLARQVKPALITLDVQMPGRDGWSVLQELKADRELANIPVVMLTIVDEKNRGYALGAAEYMTKPIERDALRKLVTKYRSGAAGPSRFRVLIVEDDENTRQQWRRILSREGCEVNEAENGRLALERLTQALPDLIILDLIMPEMDGFEFLVELRKQPAFKTVPVVVVTAATLSEEDHRRLNGGVERVLAKTAFSRDELLDELRRAGGTICSSDERRRTRITAVVRILYVEDNEDNIYMLSARLKRKGYEVIVATDGEQGLARARSDAPGADPDGLKPSCPRRLGGNKTSQGIG